VRNERLLDRQIELLKYLTSTDLIFGDRVVEVLQDPSLAGISIPHLRLEAEMSFEKRIGKIGKALPQTLLCLGDQRRQLVREFVDACRPTTYRRYDEALCFFEFLESRWKLVRPNPPFTKDVARLEIALARIRTFRKMANSDPALSTNGSRPLVRLSPSAEILLLEYEVRSVFESDGHTEPLKRPNWVIAAQMNGRRSPSVIGITMPVKNTLDRMREWAALEDVLAEVIGDRPAIEEALRTLLNVGIVETQQ
jgi:hypothetical protein